MKWISIFIVMFTVAARAETVVHDSDMNTQITRQQSTSQTEVEAFLSQYPECKKDLSGYLKSNPSGELVFVEKTTYYLATAGVDEAYFSDGAYGTRIEAQLSVKDSPKSAAEYYPCFDDFSGVSSSWTPH